MPTHIPAHAARRTWRARVLAATVALVLVPGALAGCGGDETGSSDAPTDDAARPAEAGESNATTLCLPPACGTTAPAVVEDGYLGPAPAPDATATAAVDGASVVTAASGPWWAQGLVVNGDTALGGAPRVVATLRAAGGAELVTVTTPLPVVPLRPGEPSPFRVEAPGVDAARVADVSWSVAGGVSGADAAAGRTLELSVAWTRPAGGDALAVPGFSDGGGAGSPLVTYVAVRNTGGAPLASPRVVAAWVDGRGRVLGLAAADVLAPGTADPLDRLAPGAGADAVLVLASPAADGLGGVPPLLWGVGR